MQEGRGWVGGSRFKETLDSPALPLPETPRSSSGVQPIVNKKANRATEHEIADKSGGGAHGYGGGQKSTAPASPPTFPKSCNCQPPTQWRRGHFAKPCRGEVAQATLMSHPNPREEGEWVAIILLLAASSLPPAPKSHCLWCCKTVREYRLFFAPFILEAFRLHRSGRGSPGRAFQSHAVSVCGATKPAAESSKQGEGRETTRSGLRAHQASLS